jgi:hypothetical protein
MNPIAGLSYSFLRKSWQNTLEIMNAKYLEQLAVKCGTHLNKKYNFDKFEFNDFEVINAFLLNEAIFENNFNLLVRVPDVDERRKLYVPAILIAAIFSFFKNYADYDYTPGVGEIVQKKGLRYKITKISDDRRFRLEAIDKNSTTQEINEESIKKFYVTTGGLSERVVKQKFDLYEKIFNWIFPGIGDKLPSKFDYKSVIVAKKEIIDELKEFKINSKKIYEAIPFQYFSKKGKPDKNLPIDPMIYIVNDYETVREFVFDQQNTRIDTIVFIGEAKYKDSLIKISGDLRQEKFNNAIFIGKSDIENFPNIMKWNWTLPELKKLNNVEQVPINVLGETNNSLSQYLKDFDELINRTEKNHRIELKDLRKYVRRLFPVVIPSSESRLQNQIVNHRAIFERECEEILQEQFDRINEDYGDSYSQLKECYNKILKAVSDDESKINELKGAKRFNYLVVPQNLIATWNEEITKLGFEKVKSISYKEFMKLPEDNPRKVFFLSLYGYDFFKTIITGSHNISIILFKEEKARLQGYFTRFKSELEKEFSSSDRKKLVGIEYPAESQDEEIGDMIERYYHEDLESSTEDYENKQAVNIEYEITFEDGESKILDSNRSIILLQGGKKRKERISNLTAGDEVIIYENTTKERLYDIAVEEDKEGRFQEFERDAKTWKSSLNEFFDRICDGNIEKLYKLLKENGLTLKTPATLGRWLSGDDKEKFPALIKNLIVIKKTIKSDRLDENFDSIKRSKRSYRSIMIALGKDLSGEIIDYVMSDFKMKGKILSKFSDSQVKKFMNANAPMRKIREIKVLESHDENE